MTGLDRQAHRLMELSRAGDDPSAAQLLSLHSAVTARIAAEGALAAGAGVAAKSTLLSTAVKGFVAFGAIAAGVGLYALQGSVEPQPAPAAIIAAAQPARPAPAPPRAQASISAAAPVVESASPPARASKPSSSLRLQDEAALLAEVQSSLRRGQASVALSRLESYDRRFPQGMLRSEADAARVFALCGAGRVDKARAAAARFVQRYPNAPATARVQSACK